MSREQNFMILTDPGAMHFAVSNRYQGVHSFRSVGRVLLTIHEFTVDEEIMDTQTPFTLVHGNSHLDEGTKR